MRARNPYDTGERLEPALWVKGGVTGNEYKRPAIADDFGKVDYNNDENASIATVWFEKVNDEYVMHVVDLFEDDLHTRVIWE